MTPKLGPDVIILETCPPELLKQLKEEVTVGFHQMDKSNPELVYMLHVNLPDTMKLQISENIHQILADFTKNYLGAENLPILVTYGSGSVSMSCLPRDILESTVTAERDEDVTNLRLEVKELSDTIDVLRRKVDILYENL